jgi:hypothetical protein
VTAARNPPAAERLRRIKVPLRHVAGKARAPPSPPATVAIGLTLLFVALSCWWLSRNRAMPYGDAGFHITTALEFHDAIADGRWLAPFTWHHDVYPPLTPIVGALGMLVGGRNPSAPVLAQNLVFLPLLALACYQVARRAYGALAGCLAVAFALGAPLIAEQFHVFMLDAPLTALVAGTVWLVLASERFERVPVAAAAGALAGLGLLSKQTFPLYVAGFIVLVAARDGGWRNVRGLCAFAGVALVIAAPWYVAHAANLHQVLANTGPEGNIPPLARPALLSTANVSWYFWALANGVLFTPLLAFVLTGVTATAVSAVRRREPGDVMLELVGGLALAFAAITAMQHKDVRYAMPLMVFLAVLGTGWIARLRPRPRTVAAIALGAAVVASTIGATFGVGPTYRGLLPGNWYAPQGQGVMPLDRFTLYSNHNYMVSKPRRFGDLLGLFDELHDAGVREVAVFESQAPVEDVDFNVNGVRLFARLAHLSFPRAASDARDRRLAWLIHARALGRAPPCVRMPDGGVWIRLGDASAPGARDFCPRFARRFYGP